MSAPMDNGVTNGADAPAATGPVVNEKGHSGQQTINNDDVEHWKGRVNELMQHKGQTMAAVAEPKPWHAGLFGCFSPIDTCEFSDGRRNLCANSNSRLHHLVLPMRDLWQGLSPCQAQWQLGHLRACQHFCMCHTSSA